MAPQACNPRIERPTQVNPEISPQVSQPSRISFLFGERSCFQGNKAVSDREQHLTSFYGLHVGGHSYTHVHALYTHTYAHTPHAGGELGAGWRSLCLGTSALCHILLRGRYHEVVNRPLKGGAVGDEGWGQWSSWGHGPGHQSKKIVSSR